MKRPIRSTLKGTTALLSLLLLSSCGHHHIDPVTDTITATKMDTAFLIKQDTGSYCKAGEVWGARLRDQQGALYGEKQADPEFASFLRTGESPSISMKSDVGRFYFGVTDGLREKFNACFTTSYNRLDAEKVLGQHIAKAAYDMGAEVGANLARWPVEFFNANIPKSKTHSGQFETFTKQINDHAVLQLEFFNELLTVGSPADRQAFKVGFICRYQKEMNAGLVTLREMGVTATDLNAKESLVNPVVCDTSFPRSLMLKYHNQDIKDEQNADLPGLIYANHTLFTKDVDDLGFRVYTGEELYLRFYRRALHEAGLNLGKKLYHGLMKRNDGLDYVRNMALAVEQKSDINDYFSPGFLESFAHQGPAYLKDMLCAVGQCATAPAQRSQAPKKQDKKAEVTDTTPVQVAGQEAPVARQSAGDARAARDEGACYVQVGVFADEENMRQNKARLEQMNILNILVSEVTLKQGSAKANQVRIGPFASRSDADNELSRISKDFSGSFAACL
ncbi:MAG: SPOR domain-containing protein [Magnetococcus sp. DMHC-8]